jgi:prevent-host-death family protein
VTTTEGTNNMPEIGIKELKARASLVIDEVSAGASYVVTKRGHAAAVIVPIEDAEDMVLANAEEYVAMRRQARADYAEGRTTRLEDLD